MRRLTQSEWLEMLNSDGKSGKHRYRFARVGKDGEVLSVFLDANLGMGVSHWDKSLTAEQAAFAGGEKRAFAIGEDGEVSLLVDCEETPRYAFPDKTGGFSKAKTIPFNKWLADYIGVLRHTKREDCREDCRALWAEVNRNGIVSAIVVEKVNDKAGYAYASAVTPNELLTFTYGIVREGREEWGHDAFRKTLTATFNADYDLVFDAGVPFRLDGEYCGGYFAKLRADREAEERRAARLAKRAARIAREEAESARAKRASAEEYGETA